MLDADTLAEVRQLPMPSSDGWFFTPRFSRDSTTVVAVGATTGRVYAWDIASGAEARAIGEIDATWDTSHVLLNPDDDTCTRPPGTR